MIRFCFVFYVMNSKRLVIRRDLINLIMSKTCQVQARKTKDLNAFNYNIFCTLFYFCNKPNCFNILLNKVLNFVIELSNCYSVISEASDLLFGVCFHLSQVTRLRLDPEWNLE